MKKMSFKFSEILGPNIDPGPKFLGTLRYKCNVKYQNFCLVYIYFNRFHPALAFPGDPYLTVKSQQRFMTRLQVPAGLYMIVVLDDQRYKNGS